jgi:hypothetical protein
MRPFGVEDSDYLQGHPQSSPIVRLEGLVFMRAGSHLQLVPVVDKI